MDKTNKPDFAFKLCKIRIFFLSVRLLKNPDTHYGEVDLQLLSDRTGDD